MLLTSLGSTSILKHWFWGQVFNQIKPWVKVTWFQPHYVCAIIKRRSSEQKVSRWSFSWHGKKLWEKQASPVQILHPHPVLTSSSVRRMRSIQRVATKELRQVEWLGKSLLFWEAGGLFYRCWTAVAWILSSTACLYPAPLVVSPACQTTCTAILSSCLTQKKTVLTKLPWMSHHQGRISPLPKWWFSLLVTCPEFQGFSKVISLKNSNMCKRAETLQLALIRQTSLDNTVFALWACQPFYSLPLISRPLIAVWFAAVNLE